MDYTIIPGLLLLDERIKHLELNTGTVGVVHNAGTSEIMSLENKLEGNLREVAAGIYRKDVFSGGRWFRSHMECVDFKEKHPLEGQFKWSIEIVSYLQFVTGEIVLNADSQRNEVHVDKAHRTKEHQIIISALKTDVPPVLGGPVEGKESTTTLTEILTPELWNAQDGVRGIYHRS